jgi:hypothetical protein
VGPPLAPAGAAREGTFVRTLIATAVPVALLSILSTVRVNATYGFWYLAVLVWFVLLVVAFYLSVGKHRSTASGMLAGAGIGVLVLFTTCLVNLNNIKLNTSP